MKTISFILLIFVFNLFFFFSCKKDEPGISDVPEITSVTASPTQIVEFEDSILFTIGYRDGNGDLGENNADAKNLFITDNRINITYSFRIKQLAPSNSTIPIQGTIHATLNSTGITDGSSQQNVSYSVYVVDRAGNRSNVATTTTLVIVK